MAYAMSEFEDQNPLSQFLAKAGMDLMSQQVQQGFCNGMHLCMKQNSVNLDAAIVMLRQVIEAEMEMEEDRFTPEIRAIYWAAFDGATIEMQSYLRDSREFVKLHENGSATPLPYDPVGHLETKAEFEMMMAEHRKHHHGESE